MLLLKAKPWIHYARVFPGLDKQPGVCIQSSGFSPAHSGFLGGFGLGCVVLIFRTNCWAYMFSCSSLMVVSFKTLMIMWSVLLGSILFCFLPMWKLCHGFVMLEVVVWRLWWCPKRKMVISHRDNKQKTWPFTWLFENYLFGCSHDWPTEASELE